MASDDRRLAAHRPTPPHSTCLDSLALTCIPNHTTYILTVATYTLHFIFHLYQHPPLPNCLLHVFTLSINREKRFRVLPSHLRPVITVPPPSTQTPALNALYEIHLILESKPENKIRIRNPLVNAQHTHTPHSRTTIATAFPTLNVIQCASETVEKKRKEEKNNYVAKVMNP